MKRPARTAVAATAFAVAAVVLPIAAFASSDAGASAPACATQNAAVTDAREVVADRQAALARAEATKASTKRQRLARAQAIAAAAKRLAAAQAAVALAQSDVVACQNAQPTPTVTTTATATATTTATATATTTATVNSVSVVTATPTPSPLVWRQGTALLGQTRSDYSSIPALAMWDGVAIGGTGFGSAFTADPAHPGYFYGLTDRGPNVTAPDGSAKLEPLPTFQNAIGYFHLVQGSMVLVRTIGLTLPNGEPLNGLANTEADTGETILDVYGDSLPRSKAGFDSEGLAVASDGTFWVSDEYGPFIAHFDATGKEIGRFDAYQSASNAGYFGDPTYALPGELKKRKANKGMEGLTITPDGNWLVGIMQASLDKNGSTSTKSGDGAIVRIVKISLSDPTDVREYLYALHTGGIKNALGQGVSEITAIDADHFVVNERDGKFEGTSTGTSSGTPNAVKNLWTIDLTGATDVGPRSPLVANARATARRTSAATYSYNATNGLLIDGKTIEDIAGTKDAADAVSALAALGITVGAESLYLNYAGLIDAIDPTGQYFGHDKVEGVSFDPANPNYLYLANDSDFGLTDLPGGTNPTSDNRAKGTAARKLLPGGVQDFGEVLLVDLSKVDPQFTGRS